MLNGNEDLVAYGISCKVHERYSTVLSYVVKHCASGRNRQVGHFPHYVDIGVVRACLDFVQYADS
jgi:hypothetical protein